MAVCVKCGARIKKHRCRRCGPQKGYEWIRLKLSGNPASNPLHSACMSVANCHLKRLADEQSQRIDILEKELKK